MLILHFSRSLLKKAAVCGAVVLLCGLTLTVTPGLRPVDTMGQKPVYAVDRTDKVISLSFDASWGAEHTEELLSALEQYDVKTTFFLVNLWMEEYPDLVREIHAQGHEIGLHSATHPHFTELSEGQMTEELDKNRRLLKELTGENATLFRPPYGDYNDTVIRTAEQQGLTAVQWSVDSLDWKGISAEEISRRVMENVTSGSIILLHNNGDHTVEAVQSILPTLLKEGYKIVPVGEILIKGDSFTDSNGIQHNAEG